MLNKLRLNKNFLNVLFIFLVIIIYTEYSMAGSKNSRIKLDLSGYVISFSSPVNYSKDFPLPSEQQYLFNIYEKDLYAELNGSHLIRRSYWDYGKGIFFGAVNGTLSMDMILFKSIDDNINVKDNVGLITALKKDFETVYDKQAREEFGIEIPEKYLIKRISTLDWGYYEFVMGRGERHVVYAVPISEQYYLMIAFTFINNSHGENNSWKETAEETITFIMSSFSTSI